MPVPRSIIIVIILVITLLLGVGLVWPKFQSQQVLQKELLHKEAELDSKTAYYSQIRETAAELEKYSEELAKISSALPDKPSLPVLFHFLQQTSAQTGLILKKASLAGSTGGSLQEINVELELSGNYPALKDFLLALEQTARLIVVKTMHFAFPVEDDKPFEFKVGVTAHSY